MKHISVQPSEGIAHIALDRPKVNAMNSELLDELEAAFTHLAADDAVRGALLSGRGKCLSAGLDLKEVGSLDRAGLNTFLDRLDAALSAGFRFDKPLAVVVDGHAIAGGLVIAMCGDYVALGEGDHRIGLTELAVGIPFPRTAWEPVRLGMPPQALRKLVYEAGTYSPTEVFGLGVGDSLSADPVGAAKSWLSLVTSRPLDTFRAVKAMHRREAVARITELAATERAALLDTLLANRQPLKTTS